MTDYTVVSASSLSDLNKKLAIMISMGWIRAGLIDTFNRRGCLEYVQPLTRGK